MTLIIDPECIGQLTKTPKITQYDYFQWLKQLQEDNYIL